MKPDYSARKRGEPTLPIRERLYSRVSINPITGCWEWNGSKSEKGYGRTIVGSRKDRSRKTISTHRLSYILNFGEIPEGMEVCHKCDNPCCVNPDHLFVGTHRDNMDDRERKGRNKPQKGEKNGRAKLTEVDIMAIKEKRKIGVPYYKIAEEYGVHKRTVMDAVSGKNWAYVLPPEPPSTFRLW